MTRTLIALLLFFALPAAALAQPPTLDSLPLWRSDTVYFDFAMDTLRPQARQQLYDLSYGFRTGMRLYLSGHTDNIGAEPDNDALGARRAARVRDTLLALGVPEAAMLVESFGEKKPVATNDTDENRQRNRRVTVALYLQPLPYAAVVINREGQPIPGASVLFRGRTFSDSTTTGPAGRFRAMLPEGYVFSREVFAPGYFFHNEMFRMEPGLPFDTIVLQRAAPGAAVDIPELYFVGNEDELLPRSAQALPRVLRFMQLNPGITVEIAGHINAPNLPEFSSQTPDFQLSVRRARKVYLYLRNNGIHEARMTYQGYGNSEMRFPRARSEMQQEANRRVEIRVTGIIDPTQLQKEQPRDIFRNRD